MADEAAAEATEGTEEEGTEEEGTAEETGEEGEDEEQVVKETSYTGGTGEGSLVSNIPITDDDILEQLKTLDAEAKKRAAKIQLMRESIAGYQKADVLNEEVAQKLEQKQKDLINELQEFDKITIQIQKLIGIAEASGLAIPPCIEEFPCMKKGPAAKENGFIASGLPGNIAEYLTDRTPKILTACFLHGIPRVIMLDSPRKGGASQPLPVEGLEALARRNKKSRSQRTGAGQSINATGEGPPRKFPPTSLPPPPGDLGAMLRSKFYCLQSEIDELRGENGKLSNLIVQLVSDAIADKCHLPPCAPEPCHIPPCIPPPSEESLSSGQSCWDVPCMVPPRSCREPPPCPLPPSCKQPPPCCRQPPPPCPPPPSSCCRQPPPPSSCCRQPPLPGCYPLPPCRQPPPSPPCRDPPPCILPPCLKPPCRKPPCPKPPPCPPKQGDLPLCGSPPPRSCWQPPPPPLPSPCTSSTCVLPTCPERNGPPPCPAPPTCPPPGCCATPCPTGPCSGGTNNLCPTYLAQQMDKLELELQELQQMLACERMEVELDRMKQLKETCKTTPCSLLPRCPPQPKPCCK